MADTDRRDVRGPGGYGFNWWCGGGEVAMPDAPPRTFYASGFNHNVLFVVPEWDLVVVRMGTDGNPPMGKNRVYDEFFGRLAQGIR